MSATPKSPVSGLLRSYATTAARRFITHRAELAYWRTVALDLLAYADLVASPELDAACTDALRDGIDNGKAKS